MAYATVSDVENRISRTLTTDEESVCGYLLDDAAVIIDAFNASADADAKLVQGQFGQRTAHHARDGLTGRRASASPMVADAELLRIGIVGVRRAIEVAEVLVVVGVLVLVPYDEADGASGRLSFEDTREEFHLVCLLATGGELRLTRSTAVQFLLYEVHVDGDAGRKAVNHATHTGTVRFAECGQAKDISK